MSADEAGRIEVLGYAVVAVEDDEPNNPGVTYLPANAVYPEPYAERLEFWGKREAPTARCVWAALVPLAALSQAQADAEIGRLAVEWRRVQTEYETAARGFTKNGRQPTEAEWAHLEEIEHRAVGALRRLREAAEARLATLPLPAMDLSDETALLRIAADLGLLPDRLAGEGEGGQG